MRGEDPVYNPTGSWTDFYLENSYGTYFIQGDVHGWFEVPNTYAWYVGDNDGLSRGAVLARDAVLAADAAGVDFAPYANGSSNIPGIVIVHAGPGAEQGAYGIWSHMSTMTNTAADGVTLGRYTMQPEENFGQASTTNMGVFSHEWGHVMGVQDWYDPSYQSEGIGDWGVMAGGSWNDGGRRPAHFCAYSKHLLGFNDVIFLEQNLLNAQIEQSATSRTAYALRDNPIPGGGSPDIWFVENRQRTGFDAALPGSGLLIYHFDAFGTQFTPPGGDVRLLLSVEEADGREDLVRNVNEGDGTDPWPGAFPQNQRHFHDYTVPNARTADGLNSQVSVLNISDSDSIMTADLGVYYALPWLELAGDSLTVSDATGGDGDGLIEQGETIELFLEVHNIMKQTFNPVLRLEVYNPDIQVISNNRSMGTSLNPLFDQVNFDPIVIHVPDDFVSSIELFKFTILSDSLWNSNDQSFTNEFEFQFVIGEAQMLLVDDDEGRTDQTRFTEALDRLGYPYDIWENHTLGSPVYSDLADYRFVFWMTGSYQPPRWYGSTLDSNEVATMRSYMDGGGGFCLGSYSAPLQLQTLDSAFMADYLRANYTGLPYRRFSKGRDGNTVGDELFLIPRSSGGLLWDGNTPALEAVNGGQEAFYMTTSDGSTLYEPCGIMYDGSYRSLFLSFGVEMLEDSVDVYGNNPHDLLVTRIINFLARGAATGIDDDPSIGNLPRQFTLSQNYPNPFNPSTEISYTLGPGRGLVTDLSIYNVLGQKVITLVDEVQPAGAYTFTWDGRSSSGIPAATGVYLYKLTRGEASVAKKMVLVK